MKHPPPLVYYITAHGYGHGVRSCDIINALRRHASDVPIHVVSDLPVDFLKSRLNLPQDAYRSGAFDVGMVQLDSIRVDVDATLVRAQRILSSRAGMIRDEIDFLRSVNAGLVVCDIPSIPIEAAKSCGLPALAVGNFAWDWIYEDFIADERWVPVVEAFREGYRQCDLLLKLPFSEPMRAFPRHRNIPLVSTPGVECRQALADAYGIDPSRTWVMLSFTTLELDDEALLKLEALDEYVFLTMLPLSWSGKNFCAVDRHAFAFADVIASTDVVVSKPGYGILSECIVNEKPLVFAERTDFREYPILEDAVKRHMTHQHIPAAELYRGELGPCLEKIKTAPPPREALKAGGDTDAAETILSYLP